MTDAHIGRVTRMIASAALASTSESQAVLGSPDVSKLDELLKSPERIRPLVGCPHLIHSPAHCIFAARIISGVWVKRSDVTLTRYKRM